MPVESNEELEAAYLLAHDKWVAARPSPEGKEFLAEKYRLLRLLAERNYGHGKTMVLDREIGPKRYETEKKSDPVVIPVVVDDKRRERKSDGGRRRRENRQDGQGSLFG